MHLLVLAFKDKVLSDVQYLASAQCLGIDNIFPECYVVLSHKMPFI